MDRIALLSLHGCPVARLGERDTGGMNVYLLHLARELGRLGFDVDVFTRKHDPKDPQVIELGEGARVVHLQAGPHHKAKETLYEYIPEFVSSLLAFQESAGLSYDVVHSHYWLSGRAGMALSDAWDVPHVTTFHTLAKIKLRARAGEKEPDIRISTEKLVVDGADGVVVSTEQEKEDLVRLYAADPSKIHMVPAGVDLELFRPIDQAEARHRVGMDAGNVILYVGRIEPLKGLEVLLRAFHLLEDRAGTKLVIVGGRLGEDTELDRLTSLSHRLGITDMVTFTGSVPHTELPNYYCAADVLVLPSYYESFGLVALEAMACGTPVVVSRVGGLKSFVRHGETGYLVPWRCPEAFAQRLEILLANPGLRDTMAKAARAKAMSMSWSEVATSLSTLYSGMTDGVLQQVSGA